MSLGFLALLARATLQGTWRLMAMVGMLTGVAGIAAV